MINCIDSLASAAYQNILFKALPRDWGFSGFATTFGDFLPVAKKGADLGHPLIKIHGVWKDKHDYGKKEFTETMKQAERFYHLTEKFPETIFQYSLYCEHPLDPKVMLDHMRQVDARFPHYQLVNTPMGRSQFIKEFHNEAHVYKVPANSRMSYQYSHDGLSSNKPGPQYAANGSVDCDIQMFKDANKQALAFWYWLLQYNLRKNSKDTTPRPDRKCKPTVELILSTVALAQQKLDVKLQKGWLYKSHAEQHNDIDARANKPVVLTPIGKRVNKVELWNVQGVVARLADGGITDDGRQSWRCNKFGYTLGRELTVMVDGQGVGTVDAPFRQNEYRNII